MAWKPPKMTFWRIVIAVIVLLAIVATAIRFLDGLRASTNLTDDFPWGIWIGFDVMVGVGLASGGFVIAATVHIFHIERYESISRPVILTAFLGYLLVIVGLLFDLGRPYRIWHPLIMWNPHSVMFEVAWCVMLYTIVLALEFSPVIFERLKWNVPLRWIRAIYLPVVIAGVILSTMHQSSLGTLYVIVPDKLHGLWYTPLLPVCFFLSAVGAGLAMTIFESYLSFRAFGKSLERDILVGLSRVIVVIIAVSLVMRTQDLWQRGNLSLAWEFTEESVLFWGEVGLGILLPMILYLLPRVQRSDAGFFFASFLVILGFILNRLNVAITGMAHSRTYIPKWTEIAVTAGIVAMGFVVFGWAVKHFPIFSERMRIGTESPPAEPRVQKIFSGALLAAVWTVLFAGVVIFLMASRRETGPRNDRIADRKIALSEQPLRLPPDLRLSRGTKSPGPVLFSHDNHVSTQKSPDCLVCHDTTYRMISGRSTLPGDENHGAQACGRCHNGRDAFAIEGECETCHAK